MNARYKFTLNGLEFDNPDGWKDWSTDISRDDTLRGIVLIENGSVTFHGNAFQYILEQRNEGFCNSIEVKIFEDCTALNDFKLAYEGLIFLSEVEFNLTKCEAECEFIDNSYFAKISNNKNIECSMNAGKSKNGVDIDLMPLYEIQMYNPCDGVDSGLPKPLAYRAHDVAAYIMAFMTDDEVGFESTALWFTGEFEGVFLTKGILMTDPSNAEQGLIFKWEEFLRNICNACNLAWLIRIDNGRPIFVLEKKDDTYLSSVVHNFDNVIEIKRKIDSQRNYAAVELGTDDTIDSLGCGVLGGSEPAFPDQINLMGCKKEQFAVVGTCNIDSTLDLTLDWVISSNVVENIYFNGDTGYDEKVVLIDCDNVDPLLLEASAIKGDVFGTTPPVYYNSRFFNAQIANRHLRGIPGTLVKYLNAPDTGFKAEYTGAETITLPPTIVSGATITFFPFPFGDDFTPPNFDLNNDYGNGTAPNTLITQINSRYDAPFDNVYKFQVNLSYSNTLNTQPFTVTWERYDAGLTLLASYPITRTFTPGVYVLEPFVSPLIFLNATDVVAVRVTWTGFVGPSLPCTWELLNTGTQGGTFEVINTEDYIADQFLFEAPLTLSDFYKIQSRRTEKITANDGRNYITGWIDQLSYDRNKMMAEVILINDGR